MCESWTEETWVGFDSWMTKRIQRSERDAAYRARKTKARRERSRSPRSDKPSGLPLERGRARTRRTAPAVTPAAAGSAVNTAIAGDAVNTANAVNPANAGDAGNPAIAVTAVTSATAVSASSTASTGKRSAGKSPTPEHRRRSPRKAMPSTRLRDESPPTKKSRGTAAPSRKKGGATKSGASEGSSGPTTRSSTRRTASAAAATSAVITAPAVSPAVAVSPSVGRTPTKAALKSYDAAQVGVASPMRDPLFPELEADPLGGDPYVDLFGEDSDGEHIPCGQQENMEKLFELAGRVGSQGHGLVEEDLFPPPVLTLANQPQPQPTPNVPPVFDIATLVAALKAANPPPPPQQPDMTQSILAITQSLVAISQKLDKPAAPEKRPRSPSLSPSRCSPPPSKRPHRREASPSPTRTRSGRSSPASLSPGQFSDQSDDEDDDHFDDQVEEVFDPCGLPPVEAWSELDRELLGATSDKPAEPVAPPEVPPPLQTAATASTSTAPVTSVYARLGPPRDGSGDHTIPPHPDLTRSWREFSRPLEFVPVLHALAKVLKFSSPPSASPPPEESEFSVFATPTSRAVEAPALWARDGVSKIACTVDDRRVVKEAGSFGDSTLARFFPLVEEDETLLKVLEVDAEVTEYMRSTYKLDWDPAKPFGPKGPHPVTKEAERFAKQVESTSSLLARLSIYLQRTQGFISATIVSREKERAALLAGLTPPPMPECMVDETLAGAVSLANYLTAAIGRISTRQKLEAGFDRRIRFLSAALAENKKVVPTMARLRLRELPLTKGLMFAGQWTQTVESTTKTQLLSASQAQLARDQPSTSKQSGDRFRIPFKKGRGSGGKYNKKGKKGGGGSNSSSSEGGGGRGAGRGRGRGRGGGAKKDAYSTYNTPKPAPKADAE